MFRIFVDGEYLGEVEYFPWQGGKDYYLYDLSSNWWFVKTSTNTHLLKAEKVPKEYRALNLLL